MLKILLGVGLGFLLFTNQDARVLVGEEEEPQTDT